MTTDPGVPRFHISGTVRDHAGVPVTSVSVEVCDLRLGGQHRIGTADVGPDGTFALAFDPESARSGPGASLDLVVTVGPAQAGPVDASSPAMPPGPGVLARSAPRFDAGPQEVIDVQLPAGAVPAADEYSRLVADIGRGLAGAGETAVSLAAFVEDDQRRDVTYAAAKSGRDPRTVAMASLAERESAATGIPAPLHYALYRSGLPAGQRLWALTPPDVLEAVWSRAAADGIVAPGLAAQIPASLQTAGTLAGRAVLDLPTGVGDGRLEDLLSTSLPDGGDRERFARIYSQYRQVPATFWSQLRQEFPPGVADRLRIDGELAALTRNNTALMSKLQVGRTLQRAGDLAAAGYHRPERWRQELTADVPVPDGTPGDDDSARRDAYATALAAELRLRYPTAVLGAEVAEGTIPVSGPAGAARAVADFLADHHDRFELTAHPVDSYLSENGIELAAPVRDEVAALQRIVAVAPTPEAVRGLRRLGFDSARAVVRHGEPTFVTRFAPELGGEQAARETFRRSEQVHTAVLATAASHLVARAAPELYAIPGGGPVTVSGPIAQARLASAVVPISTPAAAPAAPPAGTAGLASVRALPNLETLFGPGDAGACDECESVLSPAAYLVDLLEFLRTASPPTGTSNPLDMLLARRPDLEHIALSCENTETELPYVDLANEILEYVVVHDSIDGYTGHDVAPGTSSADLLASPQFVDDTAYAALAAAPYPLVLPWDQRLAALRGYLAQAGVTLRDAMAALAADDANGRSWSDVVRERLGISPADRDLLSGSAVTPQVLYGDDPAQVTSDQLVAGAANATRLARRLGLAPADLVGLIRTRFVNPDADLLVLLSSLGVGIAAIKGLHDGTITPAAFRAQLPPQLDPAPFGGDVVAWLTARYDRIMNIVVLTDPTGQEPATGDSTGGFTAMELRRALPDPARNRLRPVDLLAIARFVRLRTRLGWSIERTDDVVTALWPAPIPVPGAEADVRRSLDAGFGAVLVRLGHLLAAADRLGLDAAEDLPWLLGCFAPLRDAGPDSPYRTLFPGTTLLGSDPVFGPGPDGKPPAQPGAMLLDHRPALQAALKLTADELDVVVRAAGAGPQTPLSLDSISQLFRYGYLARALQIGVADLTGLIQATGWKPFDPLDQPDPDFLKLIRLVQAMTGTELPLSRLVALALGTDPADEALSVLRSVRAALADPRAPAGGQWSSADLRSVLTTVYPPDVADAFLSLLGGSSTYTAAYQQDQPTLPAAVLAAAPALSYDAGRALLIHRGVLPPEAAAAVTALPGLPPGLAGAIAILVNAGQAEYQPLLTANQDLAELWRLWLATPAGGADDPDDSGRRGVVGAALLAALRPALHLRQLAQLLGPELGTDAETVAALMTSPAAVPGSAAGRSAGDDLTAVTATGFSARFWAGPATGAPARVAVAPALDYGPGAADVRLAAGIATGAITGVWAAVADPPVSGVVTMSVDTDGSAVTLQVDGNTMTLQPQGTSWTSAPVQLTAGQPVRLQVAVTGLTARATLRWQAGSLPAVVLPGQACCPADLADAFAAAYRRLRAALELMTGIGLSARELLVLAAQPADQINGAGWLSAVPATAASATATSAAFVAGVASLARYGQLRERWAVTGTAIVDLIEATVPGPPSALIAPLAGLTQAAVDAIAVHLQADEATLRSLDGLWRVADAAALTRSVVLPADVLARTVRTTPSAQDVRDVRDAVQARYDAVAWDGVVQPIHNQLRRAARDALVAQVLHLENPDPDLHPDGDAVTGGYVSADQLYEKLLIDVQMDPCMTTSRIAQAISTVQLFVARILLNLEPEVSPAAIDPQRWEVMKHYRIWEASRRVFLFPENWLDPDLRDDKSPFFEDIESELLQSDITDQAAATALGHYLEQLDEVAKLEIAGMHVEERDAAGTGVLNPLVHVIGRTSGSRRSYYHRTLDATWLPWEPVNADIPDDPVIPVIWQGRFLLFWLKISKQPDASQPGPFAPTAAAGSRLGDLKIADLKLHSSASLAVSLNWTEFYNDRWQPPRTSDPDRPIDLGPTFSVIGDPLELGLASDITTVSTGGRESLGIIVLNPSPGGTGNTHFRLYTTHSLPVRAQDDTAGSPGFPVDRQFSAAGPFVVSYSDDPFHQLTVLHASPSPYRAVGPMHRLQDPHHAPFFFQDSMNVFYVHPNPLDGVAPHAFGVFPRPVAALAALPDLTANGIRHG